jgi:hypothetical protein
MFSNLKMNKKVVIGIIIILVLLEVSVFVDGRGIGNFVHTTF